MRDIDGIEKVVQKLKPHYDKIEEHFEFENDKFKTLLQHDHDLVGRVLKCHLIIEHYLERFLADHYGIDDIDNAKLSFFQKAQLLPNKKSAAAFVKPGILKLNSIRNRFGHTLQPDLSKEELGKIGDVLSVVREGVEFDSPIEAIEAFTTVAVTFLIVPPKELQEVFIDAFSELQVNQL
jgi:hypothetical protein